MAKTPVEKMNDFVEEVEKNNPIKKVDIQNTDEDAPVVPERDGSYSETSVDRSRTNKGPIGIDRDAGQL